MRKKYVQKLNILGRLIKFAGNPELILFHPAPKPDAAVYLLFLSERGEENLSVKVINPPKECLCVVPYLAYRSLFCCFA